MQNENDQTKVKSRKEVDAEIMDKARKNTAEREEKRKQARLAREKAIDENRQTRGTCPRNPMTMTWDELEKCHKYDEE